MGFGAPPQLCCTLTDVNQVSKSVKAMKRDAERSYQLITLLGKRKDAVRKEEQGLRETMVGCKKQVWDLLGIEVGSTSADC